MRTLLILCCCFLPFVSLAEEVTWDPATIVRADVDCDGVEDKGQLGYIGDRVRLVVTLGATQATQFLEFGLGDSMAQDSLCGTDAKLEVEDMDYDLIEAFGGNPEGFQQSKMCNGLRVMGGECDSMHIFWNHDTKSINWWRL